MKKSSLTEGNIGKALLFFVLPIIAGSLIQQLYTTVDAVIVGQFTGKTGLAAIDSVHTLFKFPINFMNGLAAGATIIISGYFGAKEKEGRGFHASSAIDWHFRQHEYGGKSVFYQSGLCAFSDGGGGHSAAAGPRHDG